MRKLKSQIKIKNLKQLRNFAKDFLIIVRDQGLGIKDGAVVIALVGPLGVGKTAFTKEFLRLFNVKQKITSPSFVIVKSYEANRSLLRIKDKGLGIKIHRIFHIDAYRLNKPKELLDLDLKDMVADPGHMVIVEWADRVKKIMPKDTIWLEFKFGPKEMERVVKIKDRSSR